jgi:hypothetical protein
MAIEKEFTIRYIVRNSTRYGREREYHDVVQVFAPTVEKAYRKACKCIPSGWLVDMEVKCGQRGEWHSVGSLQDKK